MSTYKISTVASAAVLALLTACSSQPTKSERMPSVSGAAQTQGVAYGRVSDIQTTERGSATGKIVGAVIGAAVGSQVGSGTGRAAATGAGAVGGAIVGHQIDKRRADDVYRVSVRMDDGTMRAFDFERVDDLRIGDRVKWENGQLYRM